MKSDAKIKSNRGPFLHWMLATGLTPNVVALHRQSLRATVTKGCECTNGEATSKPLCAVCNSQRKIGKWNAESYELRNCSTSGITHLIQELIQLYKVATIARHSAARSK